MRLAINIDHIATIRNARGGILPDPVEAARVAEMSGAEGIVCHLREDRRHIKDDDVFRLRKSVSTKLDLEMAATKEIIGIAKKIKPDLVTLVPEKRRELTTEGGLDVVQFGSKLRRAISDLHDSGILVSLFIEPVQTHIEISKEVGADMIELHTGAYAEVRELTRRKTLLEIINKMAVFASTLELGVNAGHGLDYSNIVPFSKIRDIEEVSIGHAVIARAVVVGLQNAVKEMLNLIKKGSAR